MMKLQSVTIFAICTFMCCSFLSLSQPGIYNEDDMSLQALFMEAQTAKYLDRYEDQIDVLKQLLEKDRLCSVCHFEMAQAYLKLEDPIKAESSIQKAIKADPKNFGYNRLAVDIFKETQNYGQATDVLKTLLGLSKNNADLREELVATAIKGGNTKLALQQLEELDRAYGPYERSTLWKLDIYKSKKDKKGQLEAVEKLVAANPENTRFLNNLASMYAEFGEKEKAMSTWNTILAIDPDDPGANLATMSVDLDKDSGAQFLKAVVPLIENKSISIDEKVMEMVPFVMEMSNDPADETNVQLLRLTDKIVEMYPEEAKSYALRGDVHHNLGDFASANADYAKTTKLNKGIYSAWDQRMRNEVLMEDFTSLKTTSTDAMDYFPLQFNPYFYHIISLIQSKEFGDVYDQIMEASFVAAKDEEANVRLDYLKGLYAFANGNFDEAKTHVAKYEDKSVNEYLLLELLGDIEANTGNIKKALNYWSMSNLMGNASVTLLKKISEEKYIN